MTHSVCVYDNHPLYRQAIASLIDSTVAYRLRGAFDDIEDCREAVVLHPSDLWIVEPAATSADELICQVARRGGGGRVLALSACAEGAVIYRSLAAGASGYLLKTATADEIIEGLSRVADGASVLASELAEPLAKQVRDGGGAAPALTDREREVLRHLCGGGSAAEIGRQLFLGPATVRTHLSRIYDKLGVSGRAAAVAVALRSGLVE